MNKRAVNLTEGNIFRGLAAFALPLMLSNIFQQLYNTVDSVVVGRFAGSLALAATGASTPLVNLLVNFFLGIATGAGVVYGAAYGAGDHRRMTSLSHGALLLGLGAGLLLTAVGVGLCRPLLILMNTPADTLDQAVGYLRVYFLGMIPTLLYNVGAGLIRATGDSRRPLYYLLVSGCLNVVLDLLFVAGLDMGVRGAALATALCQTLSAVLVLRYLRVHMPSGAQLHWREVRWDRDSAGTILRLAVPMGLQSAMFSIANLLVQVGINGFGSTVVAGCSAYIKIDGFNYMPLQAICLALTTFVSQNLGAGHRDRVKRGTRVGLSMALTTAILCCSLCMLLGRTLLGIFTDDPEVIDAGMVMLWHLAPFSWMFCVADLLGGVMRGSGAARPVTVITALSVCALRVIWLYTAARLFDSVAGVFWCYPVSWITCDIVMTVYYLRGSWTRYAARNLGTAEGRG